MFPTSVGNRGKPTPQLNLPTVRAGSRQGAQIRRGARGAGRAL